MNNAEIINCAVTPDNVFAGNVIYGPMEAIVKGKMTRKRSQRNKERARVPIPTPLLTSHPTDSIATDFFYVHGKPYLLMKSRVYKLYGMNACRGKGKIETSAALKSFINVFSTRGIAINEVHGDNEFEKVRQLIAPIPLRCCGRDEHVPDAERSIHTIKERSRCTTNSFYGMIESALLWYNSYVSVLKDIGFKLNPYDRCVANCIIENKQCTISWYVDDNLATHDSQEVLDSIVDKIEQKFPGLTITRGNEHTFIGMKLRFNENGTLQINLRDYLEECFDEFGDELGPAVASPAARWLNTTNPES